MLCALGTVTLCGCSKDKTGAQASSWRLPGAFPGAYLHVPPMPSPTPGVSSAIPLQLDAVTRRNGEMFVRWDAPDAISATILFAPDGAQFHRVLTTRERDVHFNAPPSHGVLRISVTDGKRWASEDARI